MPTSDPIRAALLDALRELGGRTDVSDFASAFAFLRKSLCRREGTTRDGELEAEFRAAEHAIVSRLIQSIERGPSTLPGMPPALKK